MQIKSVKFIKGIIGPDKCLENNFPQIVLVGRSNAGKSSVINSLAKRKDLARISVTPGRTQEINVYLINNALYLLDMPGYGYAKASKEAQKELRKVIVGYLFGSIYQQKKVVLVIDGAVGLKELDLEMLALLEKHKKEIIILANKIDKINSSAYEKQMSLIREKVGDHRIIAYSSWENIGRRELLAEIL